MDEPRQSPSRAGALLRKAAPPPALCGFLLLLTLIFATSYAVGSGVGPVAPGMHGTSDTGGTGDTDETGGGSSGTGGMGDMDTHGGGN
ncbi:hypothetical protein ACIQI8_36000 [Streptomyces sp. NPDC092369]|uniref:hypothetical protein n=1 Tax=Streptomyces sp. NPDC092369 TaxID=3366015 RepID=UPI0037F48272